MSNTALLFFIAHRWYSQLYQNANFASVKRCNHNTSNSEVTPTLTHTSEKVRGLTGCSPLTRKEKIKKKEEFIDMKKSKVIGDLRISLNQPLISAEDWYTGLLKNIINTCRSHWPRGLRRRSAAARLLRLWVRIPPGYGCLSVASVVCCQVEVSATSWSLVHRSPTDCGASLFVIYKKTRERGGPGPLGAVTQKTNINTYM